MLPLCSRQAAVGHHAMTRSATNAEAIHSAAIPTYHYRGPPPGIWRFTYTTDAAARARGQSPQAETGGPSVGPDTHLCPSPNKGLFFPYRSLGMTLPFRSSWCAARIGSKNSSKMKYFHRHKCGTTHSSNCSSFPFSFNPKWVTLFESFWCWCRKKLSLLGIFLYPQLNHCLPHGIQPLMLCTQNTIIWVQCDATFRFLTCNLTKGIGTVELSSSPKHIRPSKLAKYHSVQYHVTLT